MSLTHDERLGLGRVLERWNNRHGYYRYVRGGRWNRDEWGWTRYGSLVDEVVGTICGRTIAGKTYPPDCEGVAWSPVGAYPDLHRVRGTLLSEGADDLVAAGNIVFGIYPSRGRAPTSSRNRTLGIGGFHRTVFVCPICREEVGLGRLGQHLRARDHLGRHRPTKVWENLARMPFVDSETAVRGDEIMANLSDQSLSWRRYVDSAQTVVLEQYEEPCAVCRRAVEWDPVFNFRVPVRALFQYWACIDELSVDMTGYLQHNVRRARRMPSRGPTQFTTRPALAGEVLPIHIDCAGFELRFRDRV